VLGAQGAVEVETALAKADLAREIGAVGVAGIAEGAANLGATTQPEAVES
jgi:hypothetical protein